MARVAAALTLRGIVLSAVRWQRVLDVLGLHAALRRLLSHYLAGQFMSNVLPTTIGGDVLRVSRLAGDRRAPEDVRVGGARAAHRLAGAPVIS